MDAASDATAPTAPSRHSKRPPEKPPIVCASCQDELEDTHSGIRCEAPVTQHHLCAECSKTFADMTMSDGTWPPMCSMCRIPVPVFLASFEQQLGDEQQAKALRLTVQHDMADAEARHASEGEALVACPFCPYFFMCSHADDVNFVHCEREGCRMISCAFCRLECVSRADAGHLDGAAVLDQAVQLGMAEHFACAERRATFGLALQRWEEAIESGTRMPCPGCGKAGMKDDACTHMTCQQCQVVWCYCCGLDTRSDECDKASAGEAGFTEEKSPEYLHNVAWSSSEKRCPMYMHEIGDLDNTWPGEDSGESPLDHFHRQRTLRLLRAVVDEIGLDAYSKLVDAYPGRCGSGCGFTKDEIMAVEADVPLYQRSDTWEEAEHEEDPFEALGIEDLREQWWTEGTPLHLAVRSGDLAAVQAQLFTTIDNEQQAIPRLLLNFQIEGGATPLLEAVGGGFAPRGQFTFNSDVVHALLAADDIDVNIQNWNDMTALDAAVRSHLQGNLPRSCVTEILASQDYDFTHVFLPGMVRDAISLIRRVRPDPVVVQQRLAVLLQEDLIDAAGHEVNSALGNGTRQGYAALHLLAKCTLSESYLLVKTLVAHPGIDLNQRISENGRTALMLAARVGNAGAVQAMLIDVNAANTADWDINNDIDVNATAGEGVTALALAAKHGHSEVITELLKVDSIAVNQTSNGLTPLVAAAWHDHSDAVSALLAAEGVDGNALRNFYLGSDMFDTREGLGGTALMVACHFGHQRTVEALLASGKVDVNLAGSGGVTPLMLAAAAGSEEVVAVLLATGQVVIQTETHPGFRVQDLEPWTALGLAGLVGHDAVAQLLRAQRRRR